MSSRCYPVFRLAALLAVSCYQVSLAAEPGSSPDDRVGTVYVAVQQAQLHSGPSEDFYPTSLVPRGTMLEVYHHTKDDWLGVRPPEGSFSWVAASDAYLLPGGRTIEITTDSAVSWIGTELGSAKQYRWQVHLDRGEQLLLLGEKSTSDADGRESLWYKIAAPSGEFRWVRHQVVSSKPLPAAEPVVGPPQNDTSESDSSSSSKRTNNTGQPKSATLAASSAGASLSGAAAGATAGRNQRPAAKRDGQVTPATYQSSAATMEDEVFGPTPEEIYPDQIYPEQPYYDDGPMVDEYVQAGEWGEEVVIDSGRKDRFDGWHAWEFDDDGLRLTLFEKLFGHRHQPPTHDPLAADPYDLTMPASPRVVKQFPQPSPGPVIVAEPPRTRGYRPWRDPRTLRENRDTDYAHSMSTAEWQDGEDDFDRSYDGAEQAIADRSSSAPLRLPSTPLEQLAGRIEAKLASTSITKPTIGLDNSKWYGVSSNDSPPTAVGRSSDEFASSSLASSSLASSLLAPGTATHELNQLQVMLSETVTGPMQTWSLQGIRDQAQDLIERGATAIERGQARLLVERIEEFADVARKQGYMALNPAVSRSGSSVVTASGVSSATGINSGGLRASDAAVRGIRTPNYDATGWMIPVLAASAGQPSHALTDENGEIVAYVSGLPGMRLDRYLNQAVGIIGLRGYLPQLQTGHIQAQRIVRLD